MSTLDSAMQRDVFYRFYAADFSYFSAKVRPALRYKRIPYVEILTTPQAYRDVILQRTGLAFIPVVVTRRRRDLAGHQRDPRPAGAALSGSAAVSARRTAAADRLSVRALRRRVPDPAGAALPLELSRERGQGARRFRRDQRRPEMANAFADRISGSIPLVGVVPESIPAIEAHTRDLLARLSTHFAAIPTCSAAARRSPTARSWGRCTPTCISTPCRRG